MASTSNTEGGNPPFDLRSPGNREPPRGNTSFKQDDAGGCALDEKKLQINPETMQGVSPLPDLDLIEVVVVQSASVWARWTEGLAINVLASCIFAGMAFWVGLEAGSTSVATSMTQQSCVWVTAPTKAE